MDVPPLQTASETLLFVDDEPLITDMFLQYMTRRGYRVLTAPVAQDALNILETEREAVRLVITDMTMPEMDGLTFADILRERFPGLPVLIATGHDASPDGEELPANVVGVIQKPYHNRTMAERVREILDAPPSS